MRNRFYLSLILLALTMTGCRTALKQVYYGIKGADGKFYELKVVEPDVLATYEAIRFEPFTNDLGQRVPGKVVSAVNAKAPETVAEANIFYPQGKTLVVNGRIIHYTGKSGADGSSDLSIGGRTVCVCRVQLTDADSGNLVGEAICWGIIKSAIRRGSEQMGKGVGKGLVEWFEERLPEDVLDARQAELGGEEEAEQAEDTKEEAPAEDADEAEHEDESEEEKEHHDDEDEDKESK